MHKQNLQATYETITGFFVPRGWGFWRAVPLFRQRNSRNYTPMRSQLNRAVINKIKLVKFGGQSPLKNC